MKIGIVTGAVVSTQKDERLVGCKLLIVNQMNADLQGSDYDEVAIDTLGAGIGEHVLLCAGSSARNLMHDSNAPVDLAVVGIIDIVNKEV